MTVGSLALTIGLAKDGTSSVASTTPSSLVATSTPKVPVKVIPEEKPRVATPGRKLTVADLPKPLYNICSCESMQGGSNPPKQFEADGSVMRGRVNDQDIGACQVNLKYHGDAAAKKGLDLFTEDGNVRYAIGLYESQGTTPWDWSKGCWGRFIK